MWDGTRSKYSQHHSLAKENTAQRVPTLSAHGRTETNSVLQDILMVYMLRRKVPIAHFSSQYSGVALVENTNRFSYLFRGTCPTALYSRP